MSSYNNNLMMIDRLVRVFVCMCVCVCVCVCVFCFLLCRASYGSLYNTRIVNKLAKRISSCYCAPDTMYVPVFGHLPVRMQLSAAIS